MLDFGFYNMDCLAGMREFPDNYFELAVVDPPYGDGGAYGRTERDSDNDSTDIKKMTRTGGTWASKFGKKLSRGI